MKWLRRKGPQVARKLVQVGVLAFIVYTAIGGIWRNYKVAHNSERLVGLMHGDTWGELYGLNEDALETLGEPYEASLGFLGFPWSSRIAGIDGADPIMVAAYVVSNGDAPIGLLADLILPLLLLLVFGKVFCSYLCPMRLVFEIGQLVRGGLTRLGVPLPEVRSPDRYGGWVLVGGLIATLLASTAIWFFILPYLALSVGLFTYVATGAVTTVLAVAILWATIDALIAPGYWCHNLCPTGWVLEQGARFSLLRLRKQGAEPCPTGCTTCITACPYGLRPKDRTHTPACDNCGRCASVCPSDRLKRRFALPVITATALLVLGALSGTAEAHHNKGLPHYGYFENYPQVPTEEYVAIEGRWEIGATIFNFQGMERENSDTPNDVKIFAYLYDLERDRAYEGPVSFEIRRNGKIVSRFDRDRADNEAVYETRETMPEEGNYTLVAVVDGTEVRLPFYIELGTGGINWLFICAVGFPVLVVFGLAIYGRNQRVNRRGFRRKHKGRSSAAAALILLALGGAPAIAQASSSAAPSIEQPQTASEHSGEVCPYCGMVDCTMDHVTAPDGSQVMIMGGLPVWLLLVGVALVLVVSFVAMERFAPEAGPGWRRNLIANRRVYRWVRSRWFQAIPQLIMALILGFLVYVGLSGSRVANLTPVAVWTIWWGGLIVAVLFFGSIWCFMCPWDGLANLMTRLRLAARVEPLSLGLRYPSWAKNVYPAVLLFAGLTWLELGYGVTTDPRTTAYMGIAMIGMAVMGALLFDGKQFCASACPVGRICGIYSTVAPIEIRGRRAKTCASCKTEDCLHGNERGYPCPTGLSLKTITSSSQCTMCTECIKSCDKQNVAINLRPFGADLRSIRQPRLDEAWLALSLLTLTLFHGLSMTPVWEDVRPGASSLLKWIGLTFGTTRVVSFTIAMAVVCAVPVVVYWGCCRVGAAWARVATVNAGALFRVYAYSLLPVALFYHLAHNLMHLTMEGGHIVPLLSDPMGDGSDYLGTSGVHAGHLLPEMTLWQLQVALILGGHLLGILVAHRASRSLYTDRRAATRSLVPMLVMMVLISIGGLFLMHLDMNMRVGRM